MGTDKYNRPSAPASIGQLGKLIYELGTGDGRRPVSPPMASAQISEDFGPAGPVPGPRSGGR